MTDILRDTSPPAMIRALERNVYAYACLFGVLPETQIIETPNLLRLSTPTIDNPFFNAIMYAHLTEATADIEIEKLVQVYHDQRSAMMWWVEHNPQPADLGQRLERRGFRLEQNAGMAVELAALNTDNPTPPNFRVERVTDDRMLEQAVQVSGTTEGFPDVINRTFYETYTRHGYHDHLRHYVGYLDDKPVACSTLLLAAGVAGLYGVCTLPEARRRGIGGAVTLRPYLDARSLGYVIGTLDASEMGRPVYERLGMRVYCKKKMYLLDP